MEGHIVLAHEFPIGDVLGGVAVPPVLPRLALAVLVGPFLGGGDIFDRRVEPDIEDLALERAIGDVVGHRNAPFQVAGDAAILQALVQPLIGDGGDQPRPVGLVAVDPVAQPAGELRLLEEQMGGVADLDILRPRHRRARLDQVDGIKHPGAVLALVAARPLIAAMRTGADHITVRQEAVVGGRIGLLGSP